MTDKEVIAELFSFDDNVRQALADGSLSEIKQAFYFSGSSERLRLFHCGLKNAFK
jgi:hypothetical protein